MKKGILFLFAAVLLVSCNQKAEDKEALLSESNGKINNVSIIIDDLLWNSNIGDSIRAKFAAPVKGFSSEEPIFTLNQYPTKIFDGIVRKSRNIIIIEKTDRTGYANKVNAFAKPQNTFYILGKTEAEIVAVLNKKADEIINSIKNSEIIERQNRLNKKLISDKQIVDRFGVKMNIGFGFQYDMVKDDFLWIRKEFSSGYNSLLIYQIPINQMENDSLPIQNIIKMRAFL